MDSVDRIVPINPLVSNSQLKVNESNKDGGKKNPNQEEEHPHPHDILELHDSEIEIELHLEEDSPEDPSIGLDLAV